MKHSLLLLVLLSLLGCSKNEPVIINGEKLAYVGTWVYQYREASDTSLEINNMLLTINANATAQYSMCYAKKSWSENGGSTRRSSKSVSLPNARISKFDENQITLEQGLGFIDIDYDLVINQAPFQQNGEWYLKIENTRLKKLSEEALTNFALWTCEEASNEGN